MILCKLGSISDLSNFLTIQALPIDWKYLEDPEKADEQITKRIFKALITETDYSKKN